MVFSFYIVSSFFFLLFLFFCFIAEFVWGLNIGGIHSNECYLLCLSFTIRFIVGCPFTHFAQHFVLVYNLIHFPFISSLLWCKNSKDFLLYFLLFYCIQYLVLYKLSGKCCLKLFCVLVFYLLLLINGIFYYNYNYYFYTYTTIHNLFIVTKSYSLPAVTRKKPNLHLNILAHFMVFFLWFYLDFILFYFIFTYNKFIIVEKLNVMRHLKLVFCFWYFVLLYNFWYFLA